jgi:hypothetical protein
VNLLRNAGSKLGCKLRYGESAQKVYELHLAIMSKLGDDFERWCYSPLFPCTLPFEMSEAISRRLRKPSGPSSSPES